MEYLNRVSGGGIWSPVVDPAAGGPVNYATREDPAFGFAPFDWDAVGRAAGSDCFGVPAGVAVERRKDYPRHAFGRSCTAVLRVL